MALLSMRALPHKERLIWQHHFNHFVFESDENTWSLIPPASRSLLGPIDETLSRQARNYLLGLLKR